MDGGGGIVASVTRSGSVWRSASTRSDIFSISSRGEDDEEALRWAALDKLPTYNRVRKGILTKSTGQKIEVDVEGLGPGEKKKLVERLIRVAEEDNEKFLLKLKNRLDCVGIENPMIEVRFENLDIGAEVYVGNRGVSTFLNFYTNKIEGLLNSLHILPSRKRPISILNDVSGIIKPSRMTLLLGPPGSGKTTLLLALAGKLNPELKVSGRVTYNGHGMHEFVAQRTSAYTSQHDVHIGEMTVRETLAFSARCQGVGTRYGEMLVGPSRALFMDEISTGLDSSTTFQIVNSLRQSVHILDSTAVIALLQPAPETYDLFDDIILLSEGQIVYQGPREHVLAFFESMGFKCPERKGVADFLQEVRAISSQSKNS